MVLYKHVANQGKIDVGTLAVVATSKKISNKILIMLIFSFQGFMQYELI
jgi:hypothetical protein